MSKNLYFNVRTKQVARLRKLENNCDFIRSKDSQEQGDVEQLVNGINGKNVFLGVRHSIC